MCFALVGVVSFERTGGTVNQQVAAELKVAFYDVNMPEDVSIIEAMESFASLLRSQLDELDAIYLPKKA